MYSRRKFISTTSAALLGSIACKKLAAASTTPPAGNLAASIHPDHLKIIPGSKEKLPSIGMGTWLTFDVPDNAHVLNQRSRVLQRFFDLGGSMVDSSPMYGSAEAVLGYCLKQTRSDEKLFAASKIWTPAAIEAAGQMGNTESLWGVKPIDLMYVHNLLNHKSHLPKLREWKDSGRIRYLGISTSHGRRHDQLEKLLKSQALDFVQLTYNYKQRAAEERLIPLARDNGIAVIVNRPFQRGHLIEKLNNQPLPGLATELGCSSWAQFLLYFVVSHPDVTAAIPATRRVDHMTENMNVMQLALPDSQTRARL